MKEISLYFHWPFCASKCPYCDFNVHVSDSIDHQQWQDAYIKSIKHYANLYPYRTVISVFFGGGTPSLMPPALIEAIINQIAQSWPIAKDAEITLEANPTSTEINKFKAFKSAGVNRLSLGIQSLHDDALKFLGRAHDKAQAINAIKTASSVFEKFSFDLIYARPNQTLQMWQGELEEAVQYAKSHLSLYQLTIERNTPFYLAHQRGEFFMPEDGLAADFYDLTQDVLGSHGLPAYETSNHAASASHQSRHNLTYWRYNDYIGIGPGAHGRITTDNGAKYATRDHHAPQRWLEWAGTRGCGAHEAELLSPWDQAAEAIMMGLRLKEGLPLDRPKDGANINLRNFIDEAQVNTLETQGLLCYDKTSITLTRQGMLRLNALLPRIIKDNDAP